MSTAARRPRLHGTYRMRRRDVRYAASIPFTLQRFLRFGPVVTRGITLDISSRGMSALVCGAPRVGETVVIELPVRGDAVEMLATVRHSSDARSGFEFLSFVSGCPARVIQDWIEELQEARQEACFRCGYAAAAKHWQRLNSPAIIPAAAAGPEYSRKCDARRCWSPGWRTCRERTPVRPSPGRRLPGWPCPAE